MNRRDLLRTFGALALPIGLLRSAAETSKLRLAEGESGERLQVTGTVVGPDGKTPRPNVAIVIYHTDAQGYYSKGGRDESRPVDVARLKGVLRTDSVGRYEIDTIRPGAYPNSNITAHVHLLVTLPSGKDQNAMIEFEDDPRQTAEAKRRSAGDPRFGRIRPVRREGGTWRVVRDIRLIE